MPQDAGPRPDLEAGRWRSLQEHFAQALELQAAERAALLDRLGADQPRLAAELTEMLRAHEASPLAIEEGVLAPEPAAGLLGRRIGPYRILELIGRGGMGEVYLAERDDQYRQRVALKVVRAGFVGRDLRARFRVERQILARLAHGSIARLLDGGVTEDGRPYLVMEHVEGVPLTDWCEERGLAVEARLERFVTACQAVEFAHRKLVVHRDLKPSNILVTPAGEVKLLDFGIAKLLEPELAGEPVAQTGTGLGLMTPEHAAPEQVRGEAVTTATDVYALGVLLYQLLCGRKPHALGNRPLADLLRDVCERDPPAPSTRVTARLGRRLAGDLDAIVLKALRKEPDQRYPSAEQLAEDVRRHRAGLPVLARHGTLLYRAGRFLRRHAAAVVAVGLFVLLLVAFSAVSLVQSRALARERDRARSERDAAEQVVQVLVGLFEASDPTKVPGGDALTVGELLARNEARILRQLDQQPLVRARVQRTLGEMYLARSDLAPAQRHLKAALEQLQGAGAGPGPEVAAVYHQLALLARRRGDAEAVPMLRRSLSAQRDLFGEESPAVAAAVQDLADALAPVEAAEKQALLDRALGLRRRVLPAGDPAIASSLHALGLHHLEEGRYGAAEPLLRQARAMLETHAERGPEHPETLAVLGHLALVQVRTARFPAAEELQRETLERQTRVFGPASAAVANSLNSLATIQAHRGDLEGAAASYEAARTLHARLLGSEHWETANAARNLARVRELQGRYVEALPSMREAYKVALRYGDGGRMASVVRGQLGALLVRTGYREEGLRLLRESYAGLNAMFPGGHAHVADTALILTRALLAGRRPAPDDVAEAERLVRRALELRGSQLAAGHPKLAEAGCWLGIVLAVMGRSPEAKQLLEENVPAFAAWGAADPADLAEARRRLAKAEAALARSAR